MSQNRRSAIAISLAGLGVWASAQAIDPTLQVVSGTPSAPVVRSVPLTTARYEASTRTLVATTRAGNFVCSTAPSTPPNALKLRLDGATYPIATTGLPGNLVAPIEYLPSTVTFALGLLGSTLPANCVSSHTTATNLGLLFETQRRLPVAETVFFDIPTRTFQIRVAEPVLCESYVQPGGTSGLAIRLNDSNAPLFNAGTAKFLPGFSTSNYGLGGFTLVPAAQGGVLTPRVQCSVPSSTVIATPGGGPLGNAIFNSGFEELTALDDPSDVLVTISVVGSASTPVFGNNQQTIGGLPGGTLQYIVTVMNNGTSAAANVRLREFVTGAQAIAQAGQPQPAQLFDGGNGSCVRIGAAGPCPAFGFPIALDLGTIPAGQGYAFTLNRVVNPTAVPGQRSQMGYAAFVEPTGGGPDANLTNNGAWLAADIISNQQPVIAAIGDQNMSEDGAPLAVSVSIVDPEGDPLQTPTVSSNNSTLFPPGSLVISGSVSPYTLTMTPAPDKNGVASITVSAGDGNSAPATRTFQMTVNAVNDPPTFTLNVAGGELVVTEGSGQCVSTACNASALDFITNRAPGPLTATDEACQIVRANTMVDPLGDARLVAGACVAASVGGVDPALFFSDGDLPRVNGPVGVGPYNLVGRLARVVGAVDCAITVIDNGTPNETSGPQTLRIRYQQAPPP